MSDYASSDESREESRSIMPCAEWESLIADLLDGSLPPTVAAAFERHSRECAACAGTLRESREGLAWLNFLEHAPEVRPTLLPAILGSTRGAIAAVPPPIPERAAWHRVALPGARPPAEPRLMRLTMTAAMTFFSLALTLNLTGVRLSEVRLSDLRPATLQSTLSRQYYAADEQVVKYYKNLRFVMEAEAQVRELRRSTLLEAEPRKRSSSPAGGKADDRMLPRALSPSFAGVRQVEERPAQPQAAGGGPVLGESAAGNSGAAAWRRLTAGTRNRVERSLA